MQRSLFVRIMGLALIATGAILMCLSFVYPNLSQPSPTVRTLKSTRVKVDTLAAAWDYWAAGVGVTTASGFVTGWTGAKSSHPFYPLPNYGTTNNLEIAPASPNGTTGGVGITTTTRLSAKDTGAAPNWSGWTPTNNTKNRTFVLVGRYVKPVGSETGGLGYSEFPSFQYPIASKPAGERTTAFCYGDLVAETDVWLAQNWNRGLTSGCTGYQTYNNNYVIPNATNAIMSFTVTSGHVTKFYLNGVLIRTDNTNSSFPSGGQNVFLGRSYYLDSICGSLYFFGIWDEAWTDADHQTFSDEMTSTYFTTPPPEISYASPQTFTKDAVISSVSVTSSLGPISSFSISPSLPTGLSFNTSTGEITGTPTVLSASAVYTVTATGAGGSDTAALTITVVDVAPDISYSSHNIAVIITDTANIVPTNSGGPATAYAISPALMAGLTFSTSTGVIGGQPSAAQASVEYTVTASNTGGTSSYIINITALPVAPTITYGSYALGPGDTMNVSPTTSGGAVASYTVSPALPAGISLNATTGAITGQPEQSSYFTQTLYTVSAHNANTDYFASPATASAYISFLPGAPSISYAASPVELTRDAAATISVTSSGGVVVSYAVSPALPAGLSLNTATGAITGTSSVYFLAADYTVTATNFQSSVGATVNIACLPSFPVLSYADVYITLGASINLIPSLTGDPPTSCSVSPSLPAGLSIDASGAITGTPSAPFARIYQITASNFRPTSAAPVSVTISCQPVQGTLISYTPPLLHVDLPVSGFAVTNVGVGPVTYGVTPAPSSGVTFNTATGAFEGTPSAAFSTLFTVTATFESGAVDTTDVLVTCVLDPPEISYSPASYALTTLSHTMDASASVIGTVSSFSVNPALPTGLSLNTSTGTISGTATNFFASALFTVTATNSGGSDSFGVTLSYLPNVPVIAYVPDVVTLGPGNETASIAVTSTGGGVDTYSISPNLPAGLVLGADATISGTPVAYFVGVYTVHAENLGGSADATVSISYLPAVPDISANATEFSLHVGIPASIQLTNAGGACTFTAASLPPGLSINSSTGLISGTPTEVGTRAYQVIAANLAASSTLSITILVAPDAPALLTMDLTCDFGYPVVPTALNTGGRLTTLTVAPDILATVGLTIDMETCTLTGTPSMFRVEPFVFAITGSNESGVSQAVLTVRLVLRHTVSYNLPAQINVGDTIDVRPNFVSGADVSFSAPAYWENVTYSSDLLEYCGLRFDPSDGAIRGQATSPSVPIVWNVYMSGLRGVVSRTVVNLEIYGRFAFGSGETLRFKIGQDIVLSPTFEDSGTPKAIVATGDWPSFLTVGSDLVVRGKAQSAFDGDIECIAEFADARKYACKQRLTITTQRAFDVPTLSGGSGALAVGAGVVALSYFI